MKRMLPVVLTTLVLVGIAWAIGPQKIDQLMSVETGSDPVGARRTYHLVAQDSSLTSAYKLVSKVAITQMGTFADTLRVISSSAADSSRITLYGVKNSDSTNAYEILRISGADTVYGSKRYKYFEAAVIDTEAAGTISIIGKRGGLITTIPPGDMQTYIAHHYTGNSLGSSVYGWYVDVDPNCLAVQAQLRWYPDFADSKDTPETGYRVLDQRLIGGVQVFQGQTTARIVGAGNDTSAAINISGAEKLGIQMRFTSAPVGENDSVNVAVTLLVSADKVFYFEVARLDSSLVDSVTLAGAAYARNAAKDVTLATVLGFPYARIVADGRAATGDTSFVTTNLVVNSGPTSNRENLWTLPKPVILRAGGYLAIYAKAIGASSRVTTAKIVMWDK